MDSDTDSKREAAASFGAAAAEYHDSRVHRQGEDLETLAAWCAGAERALDVATGGGHTAGALSDVGVPDVVAADAAPEMVATAMAAFDVEGVVADAERLPFVAGGFDAVTCRIAAHHFPAPDAFLTAVVRVLAPGGTFAFEDNVVPADDALAAHVNRIERLRDPTHVEAYSGDWWARRLRDAGMDVRDVEYHTRRLDFERWCDRTRVPADDRETLETLLRNPPPGGEAVLDVRELDGRVVSFAVRSGLFRARA